MKKIYYLLSVIILAMFSSCQEPEYIHPTAERQGITSLTAYFTSGKYVDQALAKLTVTDPEADRYEIPVPWFFPEESDDVTTFYMTRLRVRAELAPNCKIDPPLTILDLTQEHQFTYTNAQGESKQITIAAKRVKSDKCNAMSFKLTSPYTIEGFVNDETNEIYLFTLDDLKGFSAEAVACAHATIKTDLTKKKNYNNPQELVILAHDGKTERTYTIVKKYPTKIPYGFRNQSVRQLFNFEPVSRLGFPAYTETVNPSVAAIGGYLVVSLGNGSTPVYLDGLTGVKLGTVNTGTAEVNSLTNDEGGNLVLTNHAESSQTVNIYKTKSVTEAPVLFHSFVNDTDVPVGYHVKVHGNLDGDAVIILTHEGIAGVTETSKYTRVVVKGGNIESTEVVDLSALGLSWGAAPTNAAKVVPASANPADGVLLCYYSSNTLTYVNGNGAIAATWPVLDSAVSGNYNTNVMDSKTYNNATYAIHLVSSHFPMWGCGPQLRVFDATTPTSIKDGTPVMSNESIEWYQTAASGCAAADVVMAPSADGFKVFIYYFDHNAGVIGGYVADSIDI
ncbi:MAG: DUF5018 domain-containing protein [Bacteroidales bacterium]|nr:DUF5018 domain-containing protein [Bacteroidales bacterium]